jgi:choline dehydrogenase-like flavoprotein
LDVAVALKGIRTAIDLFNTTAFRKFDAKLFDRPTPGCEHHLFNSDAYWECHMRLFTLTIYHQSGTCKMGPASDKTSVVDHRLRVHGAAGIRVVDASIMPEIVAGHPNGPIMMIAEKAADMIKADWNCC